MYSSVFRLSGDIESFLRELSSEVETCEENVFVCLLRFTSNDFELIPSPLSESLVTDEATSLLVSYLVDKTK